MFGSHLWRFTILFDPRLGGCIDHTIDPKLKQGAFVCGHAWILWCCIVCGLIAISSYDVHFISNAFPEHGRDHFATHRGCTSDVMLIHVVYANSCHIHTCSCEVFCCTCTAVLRLAPQNFKNSPGYKPGFHIIIAGAIPCNLTDISVLANSCCTHEISEVVETCCPT